MIDNLLSGGAAGVAIVSVWKGVEAFTAYMNNKRSNGNVISKKCIEHEGVCVQLATISTRQETVMNDLSEIKNDVKEIFRSLRHGDGK